MATAASASPIKLGQPVTSPSISTVDTPTVSADATSDPEPALPTPRNESTQTNKLTASSSTHDATALRGAGQAVVRIRTREAVACGNIWRGKGICSAKVCITAEKGVFFFLQG